jgi:exopolyphosphatase / guanosine-5'-triphosphate,3'-diphosphate pyrophosphatase
MDSSRRAVIDVGTNSVKLLIAEMMGHEITPVHEASIQTRLGEAFYESHRLQPGPIAKTAQAVSEFADKARSHQVQSIRVIATSAARDALNASDLTSAIQHASGLSVTVIPGEQEAAWAFKGVATDPELARAPLVLLDVGGGSTEFIFGQGETRHFCESFKLGTVRLLEKFPHSDPPRPHELDACRDWAHGFLQRNVEPGLKPLLSSGLSGSNDQRVQLVGTGGTASILAGMEAGLRAFDREKIEAVRLSRDRLDWRVDHLWAMPLTARQKIPGLPPNRADVILTGALIYQAVLHRLGFATLRVSTRGLRFAALLDSKK